MKALETWRNRAGAGAELALLLLAVCWLVSGGIWLLGSELILVSQMAGEWVAWGLAAATVGLAAWVAIDIIRRAWRANQ